MASTSPYQNNDYQAASTFRPYQLPVNDIIKANMALNTFWDQGAARVKSVYESSLNLNLTLDENKEVRDNFMKEAEKQITKLSSMDLSDPGVQRQGLNIFKPLLQDKAIIQDDYLTKRQASIFSEAEKYKHDQKTKGAGYHQDNLAYALRPFKDFNGKTSREQLGQVFDKAKNAAYTPYYDVSKERLELLKSCKGDKFANTSPNGKYLHTSDDESLVQSKLNGCLEAGLSDQARQQIRMSGVVRYNDNYEALRNDYIKTSTDKGKYYGHQLDIINAQIAALEKSKGDPEVIAQKKELAAQYKKGVEITEKDLAEYHTWDDKNMADHYEERATDSYFRKSNEAFATAFAYKDIQEKDAANPIYISELTQQGLNSRQISDQIHDVTMADIEHGYTMEEIAARNVAKAKADGKGKTPADLKAYLAAGGDIATYEGIGEEKKATVSDDLKAEINTYSAQEKQAVKTLFQDPDIIAMVKNTVPLDANGHIAINPEQFITKDYGKMWRVLNEYSETALKKNPNDPLALKINKSYNHLNELGNKKASLQSTLIMATDLAKKNNAEIYQNYKKGLNKIVSTVKPIELSNGVTIGKDRIKSILLGEDPDYSLKVKSYQTYSGGSPLVMGTTPSSASEYNIVDRNGKTVYNNLTQAAAYNGLVQDKNTAFKGALDKTISERMIEQKKILNTGNLLEKGSPALSIIEQVYGGTLGAISDEIGKGKVKFNTIGGLDLRTGKIQIQALDSEGSPISAETLMEGAKGQLGTYDFRRVPGHDDRIEFTIPEYVNLVKEKTYEHSIRNIMSFHSHLAERGELPTTGAIQDVGKDKYGARYSIKTSKDITGQGITHSLLINGKEVQIPNPTGLDYQSLIINSVDDMLEGRVKSLK